MKFFRLMAILAVMSGAALPLHAQTSDDTKVTDGINAVVNDAVITYSQVQNFIGPAVPALQAQYAGQPKAFEQKYKDLLRDGLEQLVERQLILRDFDVAGYHLPDSYVDQMVQDRIRDDYNGDRITLMKTLQHDGMTFDQWRTVIRERYIVSALRSKNVASEIVISPYAVETYYLAHTNDFKMEDQIKLRMIVLNKSSPDDTNTVKRAAEILAEIKDGAKFEQMAATYSQGSQQHQEGDWGWVERSVLRKDLADAAFALKPGQVSDPIDTPDAVYLMLVEQVHAAHFRPLSEVRDDIEKTLRANEQARLEKQWIDSLKQKTFVRYF